MPSSSVGSTPGWYPDPTGEYDLRYYNGQAWTGDVSTDGDRKVSPIPPSIGRASLPGTGSQKSGTAALVLGLVAMCTGWIPFVSVVALAVAMAAIVVGIRRRRFPAARGAANAGIVMGIVGLVFAILGTWLAVIVIGAVARFDDAGPHRLGPLTCEQTDGVTRVSGSITNLDDRQRSYTIEVSFDDEHTMTAEVDDVGPEATASFVIDEDLRFDRLTCEVTAVNGPFPFGFDLGS